jgi:hypothetical protein
MQERARPWLHLETQAKSQDIAHQNGDTVDGPEDSETQESSSEEEGNDTTSRRLVRHLDSILESPAYQWLVGSFQKSISLGFLEKQSMSDIAAAVLQSFPPSPPISRKTGAEAVKASFVMEWSPIAFFKGQRYDGRADVIFDKVLTLTGSLDDIQAMTCGDYMRQTWPTTGIHIVTAIKKALSANQAGSNECEYECGVEILEYFADNQFPQANCPGVQLSTCESRISQ